MITRETTVKIFFQQKYILPISEDTCVVSTMAPNPYPAVPFIWKTPGPTTDPGIVCQPYTFLIRKARFFMHLSRARVALGCHPTLSMSMKPVLT